MTFYEAAVEILRSAGRPLHVKKITEFAVSLQLLTHVGREPEKTMNARLTQEVAKASGDSLVRAVRPGVYELREGANPQDARQTVQLRQFEDEPVDTVVLQSADKTSSETSHDNGHDASDEPNQQRRRRRGGRRGDYADTTGTEPIQVQAPRTSTAPAARNEDNARNDRNDEGRRERQRPAREENGARDASPAPKREETRTQLRPSRPMHERVISPAGQRLAQERAQAPSVPEFDPAGDLAQAMLRVMTDAKRPLGLAEIGEGLQGTAWAEVALLPASAILSSLERANARRAAASQAPLFHENANGLWEPATPEDDDFAASYAQLQAWSKQHEALLQRRLQRAIAARSDQELIGLVALVLERLGYTALERHVAEGDELATFSAVLPVGITEERVAIRIFAPDRPLTRQDVAAFRGGLHLYASPRGVIVALGGHDAATREQLQVPNVAPIDLVNDQKLSRLMIQTGVGVARFQVQTPCLDDGFFG